MKCNATEFLLPSGSLGSIPKESIAHSLATSSKPLWLLMPGLRQRARPAAVEERLSVNGNSLDALHHCGQARKLSQVPGISRRNVMERNAAEHMEHGRHLRLHSMSNATLASKLRSSRHLNSQVELNPNAPEFLSFDLRPPGLCSFWRTFYLPTRRIGLVPLTLATFRPPWPVVDN